MSSRLLGALFLVSAEIFPLALIAESFLNASFGTQACGVVGGGCCCQVVHHSLVVERAEAPWTH